MGAAEPIAAYPHPAGAAAQLRERRNGAGVAATGHSQIATDSPARDQPLGLVAPAAIRRNNFLEAAFTLQPGGRCSIPIAGWAGLAPVMSRAGATPRPFAKGNRNAREGLSCWRAHPLETVMARRSWPRFGGALFEERRSQERR